MMERSSVCPLVPLPTVNYKEGWSLCFLGTPEKHAQSVHNQHYNIVTLGTTAEVLCCRLPRHDIIDASLKT